MDIHSSVTAACHCSEITESTEHKFNVTIHFMKRNSPVMMTNIRHVVHNTVLFTYMNNNRNQITYFISGSI